MISVEDWESGRSHQAHKVGEELVKVELELVLGWLDLVG
jgi:hypothetical protein